MLPAEVLIPPTCSPLPFRNVGTPFLPVLGAISVLLQAPLFLGEELVAVEYDHGGGWWDGARVGARCLKGEDSRQGSGKMLSRDEEGLKTTTGSAT